MHGLQLIGDPEFCQDAPKPAPLTVQLENSPQQEESTYLLFDSDDQSDDIETRVTTWDSFDPRIRHYLQQITPQTKQEEQRNEKLLSLFFLDKGKDFADKYIEDAENTVYNSNGSGVVLQVEYLLYCLKLLVCGHQSSLFVLDEKKHIFTLSATEYKFRVSGITWTSLSGIIDYCLQVGSRLERLQYTVRVIYRHADTAGPILLAFANCINILVDVISNFVNESQTSRILEFFNAIQLPGSVVSMMANLLGCDDVSKALALNRLPSSCKLLNALYRRCTLLESADERLYQLVKLVLTSAADQWFDKLEDFVGLGQQFNHFWTDLDESRTSHFFVKVTSDLGINLFAVEEEKVPVYFSQALATKSVGIMNCLLLLAQYSDESVMLHLQELEKVKLRWRSGAHAREEVLKYHADVIQLYRAIVNDEPVCSDKRNFERTTQDRTSSLAQSCLDTLDAMDDVIPYFGKLSLSEPKDETSLLKGLCLDLFNSSSQLTLHQLCVPIQAATSVALEDLISIQSWLMNRLTFKIVFDKGARHLRAHMVLIRNIMLLGSGILVFDLENILFGSYNSVKAPLVSSLNMGAYGNDVGRRSIWPPSTAEINRALPQCVVNAVKCLAPEKVPDDVKALECINFGFSESRSGISTNPQDLESTSVFYMVYEPPQPLNIIVNKDARTVYNKVFRRLLQVMHVKHAIKTMYVQGNYGSLSQSTQFLNALGHHWSTIAIDHIWRPWEEYLEDVVFNDATATTVELRELIERHSRVTADLDSCFFETAETSLVSNAVDVVLSSILDLAKLRLNVPVGSAEEISATEEFIHTSIVDFIVQLRDIAEAQRGTVGGEMANLLIAQLAYNN